jgi:capsular exopolysaccharide synthesis family protein
MYRVIRTNLFVDSRSGGQSVIQVTSALPGDGKSTTATNLAIAIADAGKTVLLVDGDMRRPQLAKLLRLDDSPGLAEVLSDQSEPNDVIQSTIVKNLFVVTSGAAISHPAELLEGDRLKSLVDLWRDQYDFVIFDSPPVLAVSDTSIIAKSADAVLFTTRIVKNGRRVVERAKKVLDSQRVQVLGVVVNGYSAKSNGYGYANGYDKNLYGYGYGDENGDYYKGSHQRRPSQEGINGASQPLEKVSV